jgi:hypothetical protein
MGRDGWTGPSELVSSLHFEVTISPFMDTPSFLQNLPPDFWFKTTIFAIGVALAVLAYRIYMSSNKIYLTIVVGVIVAVIFFNWVYNRTEPKWLTPVVDKLAHFFPTKDYAKQEAGGLK